MGLEVGLSDKEDSFEAGKTAVEEAGGSQPDLVYLFASTEHELEDVLEGAGEAAGDVPASMGKQHRYRF